MTLPLNYLPYYRHSADFFFFESITKFVTIVFRNENYLKLKECLNQLIFSGKMVESKKALPKEPRLSYYSGYTNPYYTGHAQLSPPGTRNYYGPTGYPGGGGGYMNGNRFYQPHHPHPHFQVCFWSIQLDFVVDVLFSCQESIIYYIDVFNI